MPENWLEWLGVVASILTIISFVMYLRERSKRKLHDEYANGFLHGAKTASEGNKSNAGDTSASWAELSRQINNALQHLQPPQPPKR
jgi:hypothetical protein